MSLFSLSFSSINFWIFFGNLKFFVISSTSSNTCGIISIINLLKIVIYGSSFLLNSFPFIILLNTSDITLRFSNVILEITLDVIIPLYSGFVMIGRKILPNKKLALNIYISKCDNLFPEDVENFLSRKTLNIFEIYFRIYGAETKLSFILLIKFAIILVTILWFIFNLFMSCLKLSICLISPIDFSSSIKLEFENISFSLFWKSSSFWWSKSKLLLEKIVLYLFVWSP